MQGATRTVLLAGRHSTYGWSSTRTLTHRSARSTPKHPRDRHCGPRGAHAPCTHRGEENHSHGKEQVPACGLARGCGPPDGRDRSVGGLRPDGQPDQRQLAGPGFGLHRRPRRHDDRARHGPGRLAVRPRRRRRPGRRHPDGELHERRSGPGHQLHPGQHQVPDHHRRPRHARELLGRHRRRRPDAQPRLLRPAGTPTPEIPTATPTETPDRDSDGDAHRDPDRDPDRDADRDPDGDPPTATPQFSRSTRRPSRASRPRADDHAHPRARLHPRPPPVPQRQRARARRQRRGRGHAGHLRLRDPQGRRRSC